MAAKYDIVCDQGATFSRELSWLDSESIPVDLTNYTARMQVRETAESSTALLSLTTENGRIALGGTAGTITLTVSATDTAAVVAGEYLYDLEIVSSLGTVTRLLQGCFTVDAEITR
jgi:hypothetical protein